MTIRSYELLLVNSINRLLKIRKKVKFLSKKSTFYIFSHISRLNGTRFPFHNSFLGGICFLRRFVWFLQACTCKIFIGQAQDQRKGPVHSPICPTNYIPLSRHFAGRFSIRTYRGRHRGSGPSLRHFFHTNVCSHVQTLTGTGDLRLTPPSQTKSSHPRSHFLC